MTPKQVKKHIIQRATGDLPDHLPVLSSEIEAGYKDTADFLLKHNQIDLFHSLKTMHDVLSYFDNFCREMAEYSQILRTNFNK